MPDKATWTNAAARQEQFGRRAAWIFTPVMVAFIDSHSAPAILGAKQALALQCESVG
jgi:hypothetical protein